MPYQFMGRPRRPILSSKTPNDDGIAGSSDDSTQPPSPVRPPQIAIPSPILSERRSGGNAENLNEPAVEDVASPTTGTAKPPRRGRGPAKCIDFDKLRKHGKIPLKINDGKTAPCCENATVFTTLVTWIFKHHGDMSYPRWTDVPMVEKVELMDRVRIDFILDWDLDNHHKAVWKQLRKCFNAFHHELHKKYLSYDSHQEALASAPDMVGQHVWAKLYDRWGSEAFKKMSKQNKENRNKLKINHTTGRKSFVRILEEKASHIHQLQLHYCTFRQFYNDYLCYVRQRSTTPNLVEFYKEVRWSKKNDAVVTETTGELYTNQMA